MFPNGICSPMESVLLFTLMTAVAWVSQWTVLKTQPLQADPSLQNPGCESAEDFYY
jgi:hypothetical protein